MLKSTYFWMVTTVLFVCMALSFLVKYKNIIGDYNALVRSHSGLWENHRTLERYLVAKDSLEIASEHLRIDAGDRFVHLETQKPAYLKDIVGENKATVVLRLTEDVCMSCYGSLLEEFRLWGHGKSIAYITSYENIRELGKLAEEKGITASVFNSAEFAMPLDALKTPVVFVLDGKGRAGNFLSANRTRICCGRTCVPQPRDIRSSQAHVFKKTSALPAFLRTVPRLFGGLYSEGGHLGYVCRRLGASGRGHVLGRTGGRPLWSPDEVQK